MFASYGWIRRTSTSMPSWSNSASLPVVIELANDGPDDERDHDSECRRHHDVVEGRSVLLAMRIESHTSSIAAPGARSTPVSGWGSGPRVWRRLLVSSFPMRSPRVLLAGVVLVVGATAFAACSSGSTPIATPSDSVLAEGQTIYNQNCASCHGSSGGGGYGKKLAGVVVTKYPNIADQEAILVNGKGSMPSFASKLTGEQMTAVTRYTREVLGTEQ